MRKITETRLVWNLFVGLAVADAVGLAVTGMEIQIVPCVSLAGVVGLLLLIARIYTKERPEPRLAYLAGTSAHFIIYIALFEALSYILTAAGRPLIDAWLISADRLLGIDWNDLYVWGKAHDFAYVVLNLAYCSVSYQLLLVFFVLFHKGLFDRGRELFWLFVLTSLASVIIAGFFPAMGAFFTFNVQIQEPYVQHVLALRDGSMKSIDLRNILGVVQFPSFHLAMAVIMSYAVRGLRVWFPCLFVWNALVIASTPLIGGHYFVDLWAGALVTFGALMAMRQFGGILPQKDSKCLSSQP
jgi:type III secretory pathway component EscS